MIVTDAMRFTSGLLEEVRRSFIWSIAVAKRCLHSDTASSPDGLNDKPTAFWPNVCCVMLIPLKSFIDNVSIDHIAAQVEILVPSQMREPELNLQSSNHF